MGDCEWWAGDIFNGLIIAAPWVAVIFECILDEVRDCARGRVLACHISFDGSESKGKTDIGGCITIILLLSLDSGIEGTGRTLDHFTYLYKLNLSRW